MKRPISFATLTLVGILTITACESTPLETEEAEVVGIEAHLEFNRTMNPGEEVVATMWVLPHHEAAIMIAEQLVDDPDSFGSIWGPVVPEPGVDENYRFHWDPDRTQLFLGWHPPDVCRIQGPVPSIEEEILSGSRTGFCNRLVRVLEIRPAS